MFAAVLQQLVAEGRKVQIVVDEKLIFRNVLRDLNEGGLRTERQLEREARLSDLTTQIATELTRSHERVGERSYTEVEERPQIVAATGSASGDSHSWSLRISGW